MATKVSDHVLARLREWGVEHVFGYAGDGMVLDSNGDGFPDFAVGEFAFGKAGRVVVFY